MQVRELRVPQTTGSYADALVAIGVADLVRNLGNETERGVSIRHAGGDYLIQLDPELDTDLVRGRSIDPGFKFLLLKAEDPRAPTIGVFDYEEQRAIEARIRAAAKQKASKRAQKLVQEQGVADVLIVDPDLAAYKIYNSMRTGSDTYNQVHYALRQAGPELGTVVAERLEKLSAITAFAAPSSASEATLQRAASNLQFWNPIAGKGVTRPKPDGTSLGSLPDKLVDWFTEWMKFRALDNALLAYRVGDDFKIFVLSPADVPVHFLREVRSELLAQPMWGGLKIDILALLALAQVLVKRSPAAGGPQDFGFLSQEPNRVISGYATAFFKSLGTAPATMNISFLGLPGWFPVETSQQASAWLETLDEYRSRLRGLAEDHSDHVPVLLAFRDFLSSGSLGPALELFGQYAALLTQQSDRLVPFTARNLRRILMSYAEEAPGLVDIVEDEGFQNIARAIRACTVEAQYHRRQYERHERTDPPRVDIRYGLAQDWRRSVDRRDEFVQKLADFVASYNAEAARRLEKGDPAAPLVAANDLNRVLRLIEKTDHQSPGLVGRLLIAFGYATNWRSRSNTDTSSATAQEPQSTPEMEVTRA